jgi:hypothetical protein
MIVAKLHLHLHFRKAFKWSCSDQGQHCILGFLKAPHSAVVRSSIGCIIGKVDRIFFELLVTNIFTYEALGAGRLR